MKMFLTTFFAEARNQRKNFFGRFSSLITLVCWPVLSMLTSYLVYKSFPLSLLQNVGISNQEQLLVFLVAGSLVYNMFWAVVQGAGQIRYDRFSGTLEKIFLTPASKMGFVMGRPFGSIIFNTWMYTVFCFVLILVIGKCTFVQFLQLVFVYILLVVSTTVFGGFITALFLISRDTDFIFIVCDRPMNILSGTSIPVQAFGVLLKATALVFPATYLTDLLRAILLEGYPITTNGFGLLSVLIILAVLTKQILNYDEKKSLKNGNFNLY